MSNALSDGDVTAIRQVWDVLIEANHTLDWDAFEAHATEDYVHLDPRTAPLVGRQAWRAWADSIDFSDVNARFDVEEIEGEGNFAFLRWDMSGGWTEDGERVETRAKGLTIFERGEDGSWRASRNVWNATP